MKSPKSMILISTSTDTPPNVLRKVNRQIQKKKIRGFILKQDAKEKGGCYQTRNFERIKKAIEKKAIQQLVLYHDSFCFTQSRLAEIAEQNDIKLIYL